MPITKVQEVANSIGNLVLDLVSRSGRALGRTLSDFSIGLNLNIRGQRPQAPPQSHGDEQTGPFVGTVGAASAVARKSCTGKMKCEDPNRKHEILGS